MEGHAAGDARSQSFRCCFLGREQSRHRVGRVGQGQTVALGSRQQAVEKAGAEAFEAPTYPVDFHEIDAQANDHGASVVQSAKPRMMSAMSRTACVMPVNMARDMMLCPMEYSRMPGTPANAVMLV